MNPEILTRLQKPPYRSFLPERFLSTELLRKPKEERTLEENIAALALYVVHGENFYNTHESYGTPLENALLPQIMYRGVDENGEELYTHAPFSIEGKCFPPAMVLALLNEWSEFRQEGEIQTVHVKDGSLHEIRDDGEEVLISDHHGWVQIDVRDGRRWVLDLAAYQFIPQITNPDGHLRLVMQGLDGYETDPAMSGINWRIFEHKDDDSHVSLNAYPLKYVDNEERSKPIRKLNWNKASGGRAEIVLGAMGLEPGGDIAGGIMLPNFWYPKGFRFRKEEYGAELMLREIGPSESTGLAVGEAIELVRQSSSGEVDELPIESLDRLLAELVDQCPGSVLIKWGLDCVEGFAEKVASETGDNTLQGLVMECQRRIGEELPIPVDYIDALLVLENTAIEDAPWYRTDPSSISARSLHRVEYVIMTAIRAAYRFTQSAAIPDKVHGRNAMIVANNAAEMIDFSAFSRGIPTPASEKHVQYLRLYDRMQTDKSGIFTPK